MVMNRLEDRDIGILWAEHYPQAEGNALSNKICLMLCFIVRERARRLLGQSDWMMQVNFALRELGIPKDQFFAFDEA
jgi:hypothetical protein